ncbi:MAG: hypothetical protein ACFFCP_05435 [Promethearchaeota archaeon]
MKRRIRALSLLSLLLAIGLAMPASAFYFDFQYFETDKLVYEVGETINMVAKLIADFGDQGWCYVSFAVVTDLGPAFADEYFIPPSPIARYLNASYTILPEHTSPNTTGAQGFVIFNAEIFDTVSQGGGDNIEITIIRGHLDVVPESSLSIQTGIDTTLKFRVESIHNDSIVYKDELVNLHAEDSNSQVILDTNQFTDSNGLIYLNWNESLGSPGLYNLTLSSNGNEDFLPFSESFQITVLPAMSNLSIISSPVFLHCQSPDGNYVEQADIVVQHSDLNLNPVNDSIVTWETSFGSGSMINQGNGQYSVTVLFLVGPGEYIVNITAVNPHFQTIRRSTVVDLLPNSLRFLPLQTSWNVTRGQEASIGFIIESEVDWNQSLPVQFSDKYNEFSLESEVYPGMTSYISIPVGSNYSTGPHNITLSTNNEYYTFDNQSQFILYVFGEINANISINSAFYGETLNFSIAAFDENNISVEPVDILVYCDYDIRPFAAVIGINSSMSFSISMPLWISPGYHNISFHVESTYFHFVIQTLTVQVWMKTNISIIIVLQNGFNQDLLIA